jgi:hypothetical protein
MFKSQRLSQPSESDKNLHRTAILILPLASREHFLGRRSLGRQGLYSPAWAIKNQFDLTADAASIEHNFPPDLGKYRYR